MSKNTKLSILAAPKWQGLLSQFVVKSSSVQTAKAGKLQSKSGANLDKRNLIWG